LDNPELVRPYVAPGEGIPSHAAFRALADALWSAGSTFVHVPVGVEVQQPLVLEKVWPAGDDAMLSRTIVVAERDSSVTLVEDLDGRSSQSDLLYLSALYDRAKAIFYGKIRVEPTSHGTGSYQECRNMLLSKDAGADPIPVLEILTNDVIRCGHGATAGALG